ncbi:Zn-dependent peptidase ImmA (M78 family)/DNA-binding XRE family transcriptional regulator [Aquamicrobium lusatiense]|uniref:Zn-dependent peptidase ImmA (M78 family)/DNA-binding XRE family transcriptional regulator n=1 Tax=Aquamicrobium lusatiense TaxID=89772 RepID=A0A7W9VWG5_9HYPH|nr:XRE family transcriptional regulator [Aquamicrobium lusatiense]MBB6013275.1 Zn-dependent peptidase ImmA (M78 family)/DNA-binding XRE family transcriptional regulator [Aquamicrobium lusatiense]
MLTPGRLSLARKRRGLTKKGFAEELGVAPHTVLRYESGEISPPPETIERIARILDFPESFFSSPDVDEVVADAASFRSLTSMTAKDRDAALAAGTLAYILSDWVDENFSLPEPELVDLKGETPEVAARSLRQEWGLGEQPIKNTVHLMEAKGVRVFSLVENTRTVDAFSVWRGGRPFVFLNMMKTAEHSRFDAAHELGHLVLHKHGGPSGRKAEEEANRFASSFLMPAADVLARIPRVHTLNQIVEAKKRWSVSVMAMIYRLHALKVISDWQYRMFCIQASDLGYRTSEPFGIPREQSLVWHKVLTALWTERVTKKEIAERLAVPVGEIENLLFGLATNPSGVPPRPTAGGLKLVSG